VDSETVSLDDDIPPEPIDE
jgi:hypothetical protein